ncbi:hypothetical protein PT100_08825, partial [Erysipelothrix rhusiopathiae]|nr:hypothetical protein [Erysipelothrix rhusiopathiae]
RMELKHLKCNPASGAVARKLGFIEEGIKRQSAKFDDGYDDVVVMDYSRRNIMTEKLAKKYAHNEIELNKYNEWIEKGYFTAGDT